MKRKLSIYISAIMALVICLCLLIAIVSSNGFCVTIKREGCYGACPIYQTTILGNGTVIYIGERFVKTKGIAIDSISREGVEELMDMLDQADFLSFHDYDAYHITDMPGATTTVIVNGKVKTVQHYYGDCAAPKSLFDLESKIDKIANSEQWTGVNALNYSFELFNFCQDN